MIRCRLLFLALLGISLTAEELRLSGIIGQSQPPDAAPMMSVSCAGVVSDGKGRVWMAAGTSLTGLGADAGKNPLALVTKVSITLPTGAMAHAGLWLQDDRLLLALADNRLVVVDPQQARIEKTIVLPEGTTRICCPGRPGSGAARFPLLVLAGRRLLGLDLAGAPPTVLATIPDFSPSQVEAIGVLAGNGDLVLGTGYPDMRQYRFSANDGRLVQELGWPKPGWPRQYLMLGVSTWMLANDGSISLVDGTPGTGPRPVIPQVANQPCNGLAAGTGGWWLACGRGLVQVDDAGRPLRRLGGLPGMTGVALLADGTVLALERGRRVVRMYLDDGPDSAPDSAANEPWQVNKSWTSSAVAIAADRGSALLPDAVAGVLWRFDPARTAWGDQPWIACCPPRSLTAPTALAVGDGTVWVLDQGRVKEADRRDQPMTFKPLDLPFPAGFVPTLIAADDDHGVVLAHAGTLVHLVRKPDGWQRKWQVAGTGITAIATMPGLVAVAETGAVRLLRQVDGATAATLRAVNLPGRRLEPVALAARHPWIVVVDRAGARLLRLRVLASASR